MQNPSAGLSCAPWPQANAAWFGQVPLPPGLGLHLLAIVASARGSHSGCPANVSQPWQGHPSASGCRQLWARGLGAGVLGKPLSHLCTLCGESPKQGRHQGFCYTLEFT